MANIILMTPDLMRSQAAQIKAYTQEHIEIMQRMTNLVVALDEIWTGEAYKAFLAKYQGMSESFDSFEKALLSFAQLMEQVAGRMDGADQSLSDRINSIS